MSLALMATAGSATAAAKPNILAIMGDDIGYWNISAYNQGMMGYQTPNLDRIANEGALFTDHYGQQSCTAGRTAFINGEEPFRTSLLSKGFHLCIPLITSGYGVNRGRDSHTSVQRDSIDSGCCSSWFFRQTRYCIENM
ncbi:sulfatase-like hydrolase/transferase [Aeromonas veronii]|uniref:sulfatase-like hydrolase/transferase n=1 Tax=Aeromonas veronii TaxID=654 RepID=UPI001F48FB59|nr:sulfatase-like hydrolase/transferase [Aeromonas veronii]